MHNRNLRFDPQDRADSTNPLGVSIAVKGNSSGPRLPVDAALSGFTKGSSNPETSLDADATLIDSIPSPSFSGGDPARPQIISTVLRLGDVLAGRYEILQLLGEGGMGAVYKAMDRELDRPVALKLIRPQLAANPGMLARFKQELLMAHQVTHRNVIRIYDLGDADGVKFITMEFVEGQDLHALIQENKKFPPEEAVKITQQICRALEAAHSVGVIHRDLKPQNIMRDETGRILVMDFGLARMVEGEGMTRTGAMVGTMEYMSPEQALAKDLDQRSDLFSAGLIFYELLTGKMPYAADSALASLIKRTQERAVPVSDQDTSLPAALSTIVSRCLERDPGLRYQNAGEVLGDLDAWIGNGSVAPLPTLKSAKLWVKPLPRRRLAGILLAMLFLASGGYLLRHKFYSSTAAPEATGPAISLAILPFHNGSGDPSLDWLGSSLEQMLTTDVGQSARLRTVSANRLNQVLADLHLGTGSALDPSNVRRVAEFSNTDTVVWGQYAKFGDQIRIDATLQDLKRERSVTLKAEASNQSDLLATIDRLAQDIREHLALSPQIIKELQEQSFKPTSTSLEALRFYNEGLDLLRQGNNVTALKRLQDSVTSDPDFALAYSRLAQTY